MLDKLAKKNKENKNDKQTDDEDSVIIVDKCFIYPPRNNPSLTLNVFF